MLGRPHTNTGDAGACGNPTPDIWSDWPYSDVTIQEYGLEDTGFGLIGAMSSALIPPQTYDYMSYCWYWEDEPAWTSPYNFERIFYDTLSASTTANDSSETSAPESAFIASGLVYTDDTATLDQVWIITATQPFMNPPDGSEYCLEAQDVVGTVLVNKCFDLGFVDHDTGESTFVDGYNLLLPYPDNLSRIVLKHGSSELISRSASQHVPEVTIISPNGGEVWDTTSAYSVTWSATDADSDPLTYTVLYSPNGQTWFPVGTEITATHLTVNSSYLPGSSDARMSVIATDGLSNGRDASDEGFTVSKKPPAVYILEPKENGEISTGTTMWFTGYAYDLEDGILKGIALQWSSSLDGVLGSGTELMTLLSAGMHAITLTATDSDGMFDTATLQVVVKDTHTTVYLPIILRNQ